jgi:hypothetical protein
MASYAQTAHRVPYFLTRSTTAPMMPANELTVLPLVAEPCPRCAQPSHVTRMTTFLPNGSPWTTAYRVRCSDTKDCRIASITSRSTPEEAITSWNRQAKRLANDKAT